MKKNTKNPFQNNPFQEDSFEDNFDEAMTSAIELFYKNEGKVSKKEILEIAEEFDVDADELSQEAIYEFKMINAISEINDEVEKIAKKFGVSPPDLINRYISYWQESTDYLATALAQSIQMIEEKGEVDEEEIQKIADDFGLDPQDIKKMVKDSFNGIIY